MRLLFLSLFMLFLVPLFGQELSIQILDPEPYYEKTDITIQVYLVNNTPDTLVYFDSRGPSWDSFHEKWDLSVNWKFEEVLSMNTAFSGKYSDSLFLSLAPNDTQLIRTKMLPLKILGEYRLSYYQQQSPDFVSKVYADTSVTDSLIQQITPFDVTQSLTFQVHHEYDTTISKLVKMPWEEWKDYRHVQVYSHDNFYDNIYAALKHPQEVYALHLYCNGLTAEDIKRVGRLKNLRALKLLNCELDTFPEEIAALNLYELTILPKEEQQIVYPYGISNNHTLRELRAIFNGEFPAAVLEQKELQVLDIQDSPLDKLPALDSLKNLEVFNASDCKLSTLDDMALDKLPKLIDLNLSGNRNVREFGSLLNCENLEFLFINRTRIDSIPHRIEDLSKLKKLSISNGLTAITDSIGNLSDLRFLSLGGNTKLTYLPPSIIKLNKLLYLNLNRTGISELPEGISELPIEELTIQNTNCKVTKDYKELRKRLEEKFKE